MALSAAPTTFAGPLRMENTIAAGEVDFADNAIGPAPRVCVGMLAIVIVGMTKGFCTCTVTAAVEDPYALRLVSW